jgi:hypothetical protein
MPSFKKMVPKRFNKFAFSPSDGASGVSSLAGTTLSSRAI